MSDFRSSAIMRTMAIVALLAMGLVLVGRRRPRVIAADSFPFPTGEDHQAVDLKDPDAVDAACRTIGCTRHELFDAASVAGVALGVLRDRVAARRAQVPS